MKMLDNMPPANEPRVLWAHFSQTYFSLRLGLAVLAFAFPAVLYFYGKLVHGIDLQPSMSAYFWAARDGQCAAFPMRTAFVGFLFAIGVGLYLYKGVTNLENLLLNLAGVCAALVAIFPERLILGEGQSDERIGTLFRSCPAVAEWAAQTGLPPIHYMAAVTLFVLLAIVAWFCAKNTLAFLPPGADAEAYSRRYRMIAIAMLAFPILGFIVAFLLGKPRHGVFFVEAAGVITFGIYWAVKSRELAMSRLEANPPQAVEHAAQRGLPPGGHKRRMRAPRETPSLSRSPDWLRGGPMPLITEHQAVNPATLNAPTSKWQPMRRIENVGGNIDTVTKDTSLHPSEFLLFAEGDSWFDKFTPMPGTGNNLLDAIRTPFRTSVVDVAKIGAEVSDMVRGSDARQTRTLFKFFDFKAILLSAGGNDLKNLFASLFQSNDLDRLDRPGSYREFSQGVIDNIERFIELRNASLNQVTRGAPIFVHGYDYFQPRPAGARIFAITRIGSGPWLYPSMHAAGLDDARMRSVADAVVDALNQRLAEEIAHLDNVHVIDARGLLSPAAPGTTGPDVDWMDEIHPSESGFEKLARNRWDVPLSKALGWQPADGELVPALPRSNPSMAQADGPGPVA